MFNIGADYYPEHWCLDEGEERWETDGKIMEEAGFNITRMAEFAWVKLEPQQGKFDFTWLDRAIETLASHGVKSILCTPTPTMPKWLYDNHAEAVATDAKGNKHIFGNRQINCFTNETYRALSRKITEKMADHYKDNENITAWQLDNEFWGPNCYCEDCENKFRIWLEAKYGDVETLNKEYGTAFWSHCYGSFKEVHLPRHEHSSPSLFLDYKRFHSENVISFAKEQEEILRKANKNWIITHNMMGFAPNINYFELSKMLDVAGFDYYYTSSFDDKSKSPLELYQGGAAALDLTRGFKKKNFWIIENNAGPAGWECYGRNLFPGEMRRMTYQNIAHGCDTQIWFRFRTCRYGTEQYWHGLLGHDGKKGRRYKEAKAVSQELHKLFDEMGETTLKSEVAIVYDYDDKWALDHQRNNRDFDYTTEITKFHQAFSSRGINVDFVSVDDDLNNYKVIAMPTKYVLKKDFADKIEAFVKNGGTLITTCRSGVKNDANVPYNMTLPGYLSDVLGINVEEYEAVSKPYTVTLIGKTYKAGTLVDWVTAENAEVIASYNEKHVSDYAAITKNSFGKGKAYYIGAILEQDALKIITDTAIDEARVKAFDSLPKGAEIVTRSGANGSFTFILNHTDETIVVNIPTEITVKANDIKIIHSPLSR